MTFEASNGRSGFLQYAFLSLRGVENAVQEKFLFVTALDSPPAYLALMGDQLFKSFMVNHSTGVDFVRDHVKVPEDWLKVVIAVQNPVVPANYFQVELFVPHGLPKRALADFVRKRFRLDLEYVRESDASQMSFLSSIESPSRPLTQEVLEISLAL